MKKPEFKKRKLTIEERLKLYRWSLFIYQQGDIARNKVNNGFCFFFKCQYPKQFDSNQDPFNSVYHRFYNMLPELYSTFRIDGTLFEASDKYGPNQDRINCLKKAIKITRDKIKKAKAI